MKSIRRFLLASEQLPVEILNITILLSHERRGRSLHSLFSSGREHRCKLGEAWPGYAEDHYAADREVNLPQAKETNLETSEWRLTESYYVKF